MKIIRLIRSRLWIRVLLPVSFAVIAVVLTSLWVNISLQEKMGEDQLVRQNSMLEQAVEGGMFDALAAGDNDTVRSQFKRLSENVDGLKVYVYDFNGVVSFSTDSEAVGKDVKSWMDDPAGRDVSEILESGQASGKPFHISDKGHPWVVKSNPIMNESRCYHCHGQSRKVLGGISVFSSEASIRDAVKNGRTVSIGIGLAGLCLIVLFVFMFFHFVVNRKVKQVLDATSFMRKKDFTHRYPEKDGDEMDLILSQMNRVTSDLRQTIKTVSSSSNTIFDASSDLGMISQSLNTSSIDASEKATAVSAAAEELSINNRAIASAMDQSSISLNSVASAVEEMSATVNEIARNVGASKEITDQVVSEFETINAVVEELGRRADDVDLVTDEIRSISEQVSLLALNAKIEAARAGEAGRGFAVVAHEITNLAKDTQNSTIKADETLQWIKTRSGELASQMVRLRQIIEESDQAVSSISAAVEEQNVTTREIAQSITQVSSEIAEVNGNVNEGAAAASEIAEQITTVEDGAGQVRSSSDTLKKNSVGLSKTAQTFMDLMKSFKV